MRARSGGGAQLSRRGRRLTRCWLRPPRSQPQSSAAPSRLSAPPLPLNPVSAGDAAPRPLARPPVRPSAPVVPTGPRKSTGDARPCAGVGETDNRGCKRKQASSGQATGWPKSLLRQPGISRSGCQIPGCETNLKLSNHPSVPLAPMRCLS